MAGAAKRARKATAHKFRKGPRGGGRVEAAKASNPGMRARAGTARMPGLARGNAAGK